MPSMLPTVATAAAAAAVSLLLYLRARRRQTSRGALTMGATAAVLKTVDSDVLEAELERRRVGSHVFNTTVRPLHALRSQLLDAALLTLGVDIAADELTPGPPRKAYDSFARPREGEPCDEAYVTKKAPLVAQQVAFLHRHELARRNELLRNVDDAEKALANVRRAGLQAAPCLPCAAAALPKPPPVLAACGPEHCAPCLWRDLPRRPRAAGATGVSGVCAPPRTERVQSACRVCAEYVLHRAGE